MPNPQTNRTSDPNGHRKINILPTTNLSEQVNAPNENRGRSANQHTNRGRVPREMSPGRKKFIEERLKRLQRRPQPGVRRPPLRSKWKAFPMQTRGKPKTQFIRRKIVPSAAAAQYKSSKDNFTDYRPSSSSPQKSRSNSRSGSISETAKVIHETKWLQKVKQSEIAQLELSIKEGRSYSDDRDLIQQAIRHNDPNKSTEIIAMENELMAERERIKHLRVQAEADIQQAAEFAEKEAERNAAQLARQREIEQYAAERRSRSPARRLVRRPVHGRNGNGNNTNMAARNIVRNAQRRFLGKQQGGRGGRQQFARNQRLPPGVRRQPPMTIVDAHDDDDVADSRFHRIQADRFDDAEKREAFAYRQKTYDDRSNDQQPRRMNSVDPKRTSRYTDDVTDTNMASRYVDDPRRSPVYAEPIVLQTSERYPMEMRRGSISPSYNGGRARRDDKTPPHFTSKNFHDLKTQTRSPQLAAYSQQQQQQHQQRSDHTIIDRAPGSMSDIKGVYRSGGRDKTERPMDRRSKSPPLTHRGVVRPKSSDRDIRYEMAGDDRTPKFFSESQLEMKLLPLTPALYTGGGMFDKHIQRIQNEFDDRFGLRKRSMDRAMSPPASRRQIPPNYVEEYRHDARDESSDRRSNPFTPRYNASTSSFIEPTANVDERLPMVTVHRTADRTREIAYFEPVAGDRYASRRQQQYSENDQRFDEQFKSTNNWPQARSDDRQGFVRQSVSDEQRSRSRDSPKRLAYHQTQSRDNDQLVRQPKSREYTTDRTNKQPVIDHVQTSFSSMRDREYSDRTVRRSRSVERHPDAALHMFKTSDRNVSQRGRDDQNYDNDFIGNERDKQNRSSRRYPNASAGFSADTIRGDFRSTKPAYQQLAAELPPSSDDRAPQSQYSGKKLDHYPSATAVARDRTGGYGGQTMYEAHGFRESLPSYADDQYSSAENRKKIDDYSTYKPGAVVRQNVSANDRTTRNIVAVSRPYAAAEHEKKPITYDYSTTSNRSAARIDANPPRQSTEPGGNHKFDKTDGRQNERSTYRQTDVSVRTQTMAKSSDRRAASPQLARAKLPAKMTPIEQKAGQLRWESNRNRSNASNNTIHSRNDTVVKQPTVKRTHSPPPPPKFSRAPISRHEDPHSDANFSRPPTDSLTVPKRSRVDKSMDHHRKDIAAAADKPIERKRIEAPRNDDRYEGAAARKQQFVPPGNSREFVAGTTTALADRGRPDKYEQLERRYQPDDHSNRRSTADNRPHAYRDGSHQRDDRKYLEQRRLKDEPVANREKAKIEVSAQYQKHAAAAELGELRQRDRANAPRRGDDKNSTAAVQSRKKLSYFDGKR